MDHWTIIEWLLLQFGVLAACVALFLGVVLHFSRARVQRLQNEFKRLAATIGEAIAKASSEGGVQFESLLLQTQAYLESEGLGASWEELDPVQYPELLPFFLRSAVLELERDIQGHGSDEDYWTRLCAAYEVILFQFNKSAQGSSEGAEKAQHELKEVQEQADSLLSRVKELEDQLHQAKNALLQPPAHLDPPSMNDPDPNPGLYSDYERVLASRKEGDTGEDASAHQVGILSNIIDDQKLRIKNLKKEMEDLRTTALQDQFDDAPRAVVKKKSESSLIRLEEQNQTLLEDVKVLEKSLKQKDQELEQVLTQMEQGPVLQKNQIDNQFETQIAIKRAIVEAWRQSESSLADLEEAILKSQGNK